jgi:molybdopterin-guanine dinucleotide biosynthesis protein A
MTLEYLGQLLDNLEVDCGIVPMIDNCAEPLAAVYPRNAAVDFGQALSGKNFSLQPLVASLIAANKVRPIPVSDEKRPLFRNLNEPDDLGLSDCS